MKYVFGFITLFCILALIVGGRQEQKTNTPNNPMEFKAVDEPQTMTIEQAKYLARQSYRNGYTKGAMQSLLGLNALETLPADSLAFERLLSCAIPQIIQQ